MTDYGHDLLFGTFLTPQSQRPQDTVALAQLTEQSGLDLATFQDHPYQPAFVDTWTLLSWVAAQTERVRVSANVLNLPLRPPSVLARAAASLDLLSGGRFELGLGAGAFWDAIAAMGGPRRTPAEAVTALSEAMDIIRAIWDGSARGGVFLDGQQYHVRGAKRGPEPAHDIPIWLGAYKPRMLRLVGTKGDGWLPSLAYLQDGDLHRGNRLIDEAALAAERDPREIRRLLNISGTFAPANRGFLQGTPEHWVSELLPLAVEHGISAFILAGDEPRAIETFGAEVAPALRAAVARERRAAGTRPGEVVRSPKALTLRRDHIDYDGLPRALRAKAIEPGDKNYPKVRSTYLRRGSPGLVLRPDDAAETAEALAFARAQRVPLAVRSGGHGISGRSTNDGGIIIDVSALNQVEVLDPTAGRVRIGPGARWGHVASKLLPYGLAISSGDFGDVGVGGLATAGGIGLLGRQHGLTVDHVLAAELVLADGTQVRADASNHPDLFWALRGAGGNFGIVTALEFNADPVRDVIFSQLLFDASKASTLIRNWGEVVEAGPRELTSFLYVFGQRGAPPVARLLSVYAADDTDAAVSALTPLLTIGPVLDQHAQVAPYAAIIPATGSQHDGRGSPVISNGFAVHLTAEIGDVISEGLSSRVAPWVAIRAVGGAVNDVDPAATSYPHRHQNFNVSSVGSARQRFLRHWDELRPSLDGLYLSFETDDRPERLSDAFPGATLTRLRRLKTIYDPANVFNANFPIEPDAGVPAHD